MPTLVCDLGGAGSRDAALDHEARVATLTSRPRGMRAAAACGVRVCVSRRPQARVSLCKAVWVGARGGNRRGGRAEVVEPRAQLYGEGLTDDHCGQAVGDDAVDPDERGDVRRLVSARPHWRLAEPEPQQLASTLQLELLQRSADALRVTVELREEIGWQSDRHQVGLSPYRHLGCDVDLHDDASAYALIGWRDRQVTRDSRRCEAAVLLYGLDCHTGKRLALQLAVDRPIGDHEAEWERVGDGCVAGQSIGHRRGRLQGRPRGSHLAHPSMDWAGMLRDPNRI